jgi:glycosyltransferase involved in cell wall biosynthesis
MKSISIVIPALNEKDGIVSTINAIPKQKLEEMGYDLQILIVDNGSSDGTGDLARKAGADVIIETKRGYGSAFKCGFSNARGEIIVTTDADATYPVNNIPDLIHTLESEKLDFITTDRFSSLDRNSMSIRNRLGNRILNAMENILFKLNLNDSQSGMWVFKKDILKLLILKSDTAAFSQELKIEVCHFAKCKWKEIPIKYQPRLGKAKLGGWKSGMGNLMHLFKKRIVR